MEFYSEPYKLYIQVLGTECFTTLSFYNVSLPETPVPLIRYCSFPQPSPRSHGSPLCLCELLLLGFQVCGIRQHGLFVSSYVTYELFIFFPGFFLLKNKQKPKQKHKNPFYYKGIFLIQYCACEAPKWNVFMIWERLPFCKYDPRARNIWVHETPSKSLIFLDRPGFSDSKGDIMKILRLHIKSSSLLLTHQVIKKFSKVLARLRFVSKIVQ